MQEIQWVLNQMPAGENPWLTLMTQENVQQVQAFHRSFPQYEPTPLRHLQGMAKRLGLGGLYVKDESYRFGLNAFKVLGGSYEKDCSLNALMAELRLKEETNAARILFT